jgi:predicted flavoprotein YhiN
MAGKTGLNISHAEPVDVFIQRYDRTDWLSPWVKQWDAVDSKLDARSWDRFLCGQFRTCFPCRNESSTVTSCLVKAIDE